MTQVDVGRRRLAAEDAGERLGIAARLGDGTRIHPLQRHGVLVDALHQVGQRGQVYGGEGDVLLHFARDGLG